MSKHPDSDSFQSEGGKARAASLPAKTRSEIAQKAADARWGKNVSTAEYMGVVTLGDMELDCAVLEDGRRVISQASIMSSLGRSPSTGRRLQRDNRPPFIEAGNLQPFITPEIADKLTKVEYRQEGVQGTREGYEAAILPIVCDIYLEARDAGVLAPTQRTTARAAEALVRSLAKVGIIALVDEATGYQDVRARDALAKILEAYVADDLQPWVKTFDVDFYKELFRLRGLKFDPTSVKKPSYFGHLTNDIVYKRVAPGVFDEIKAQRAADSKKRKGKFHQQLTAEVGHPRLREHIASVTTVMKLSTEWNDFKGKLDQVHPVIEPDGQMALWDGEEPTQGI